MERVPEEAVLGHWLSVEARKESGPDIAVDGLDRDEMVDLLLRYETAAYFLWQARPIAWYHLSLSKVELDRLRVVEGPAGMGWHALAPENTIGSAAERIAGESPGALDVRGVDVERIHAMADDFSGTGTVEDIVLANRRGCTRPYVLDGNHRAAALALTTRRTGNYEEIGAYLGIGANPVLDPLWERLCGVVSRLVRRERRW